MKARAGQPTGAFVPGDVDLILFARHMQETARTPAARRLFGEFLDVELKQWREARRKDRAAPRKGGADDGAS